MKELDILPAGLGGWVVSWVPFSSFFFLPLLPLGAGGGHAQEPRSRVAKWISCDRNWEKKYNNPCP